MKQLTSIFCLLLTPALVSAQTQSAAGDDGLIHQLLGRPGGWLTCLSLILAITAICMQLFHSRRRSGQRSGSGTELRELQGDMTRLQRKLDDRPVFADLKSLTDRISALEGQAADKDSFTREISWEREDIQRTIATEWATPRPEESGTTEQPAPPQQLSYAKLADLENGFSPAIITRHQDGEQLFEIREQGDQAVYRITDDANAQRYALTEPATLSRACELLNQPFKGCRIVMQRQGTLSKTGDQWLIQSKAQIAFK